MIAHAPGGALVTGAMLALAAAVLGAGPSGSVTAHRRTRTTAAGLAVLAAALSPPMDSAAERVFAAHMAQHLVLLVFVPALLTFGRAAATTSTVLHSLFGRRPSALGRVVWRRWATWRRGRDAVLLAAALAAQIAVVSAWHLPALFRAAVNNPIVHVAEHISMLAAGVILLATLRGTARRVPLLTAAATFGAALHGAALGALITFAATPTYAVADRGLATIDDQQLAGLLMWIPIGALYTAFALILLWRVADHGDAVASRNAIGRPAYPPKSRRRVAASGAPRQQPEQDDRDNRHADADPVRHIGHVVTPGVPDGRDGHSPGDRRRGTPGQEAPV